MIRALTPGPDSVGAKINRATALSLIQRYKNILHSALQSKIGLYNTAYVWFSLADLKAFVDEMDEHQADGIRVYFGALNNPDNATLHNKQTVVFVCTKQVPDTDCHEEMIDDVTTTVEDGYDFGSLCPPECNHCSCEQESIAQEVFGDTPCDM
jgi:hypothetical protein